MEILDDVFDLPPHHLFQQSFRAGPALRAGHQSHIAASHLHSPDPTPCVHSRHPSCPHSLSEAFTPLALRLTEGASDSIGIAVSNSPHTRARGDKAGSRR